MTEDKIKDLLQKADQTAPSLPPVSADLGATIHRLANQRRLTNIAGPLAAAAVILIAFGIWHVKTVKTTSDEQKMASLEAEIQQLQARTDATLKLIREVLDYEQKQRHLRELEAKLASIPDPLEEMQRQIDKTAFILVYQADHMYRELDQKDSAIRTYNRVIKLFPHSRSAELAKQRLSKIQNNNVNEDDLKI